MVEPRLPLDVLIEICEHLSPGPLVPDLKYEEPLPSARRERRDAQKTLACLARVCHVVSKSALDVLWQSVDDMTVVMRVLPTFSQSLREDGSWDWDFDPRPPTPEEWKRFEAYAWRVRELRTTTNGAVNRLLEMAHELEAGRALDKSRPFFPRLYRLEVFHLDTRYPLAAFCSPKVLRHLSIDINIPELKKSFSPKVVFKFKPETPAMMVQIVRDTFLGRIAKELQPFLANLESLTVEQHHGLLRHVAPSVRERIPFWTMTHLRELTVVHEIEVTMRLLQALMDFPHLRQLALRVTVRMEPEERDNLKPGFAALRDLSLEGGFDHCVAFIEAIRPLPPLERLRIGPGLPFLNLDEKADAEVERRRMHALPPVTDDHLKNICAALPVTLQSLCLELPRVAQGAHVQSPTLLHLFRYLAESRASGLRSLTLVLGASWKYVTDEELRFLCDWPKVLWPDLVSLRFVYGWTDGALGEQDPPTLGTLAAFVEKHPVLERLAIPTINVRKFLPLPLLLFSVDDHQGGGITLEAYHTSDDTNGSLPRSCTSSYLAGTSCLSDNILSAANGTSKRRKTRSLELLRLDTLPPTVHAGALADELDALFPRVNVVDVGERRPSRDSAVQSLQQELRLLMYRS